MTTQSVSINPAAKALLPTGRALARADILRQLGLNPNTPVDGWLAIVACGANAAALTSQDLKTFLTRGTLTGANLQAVQTLAAARNIR